MTTATLNSKPLNILLVEDDDGDAKAVRRAFQKVKIANPIIRAVDGIDARTDGPGRLTKALGVSLRAHNGVALDAPPFFLARGEEVAPRHIAATARIGVDYAGSWARRKLRFFDKRSAFVSAR